MQDGSWSFVQTSKDSFPPINGKAQFESDKRTCVLPVELEADKTYVVWLNRGDYQNFKDTDNRRSIPYLLVFKTKKV